MMVWLCALVVSPPVQDEAVSLISGGGFEQDLSSDWKILDITTSRAESKDKKIKRILVVKGPADAKVVGILQVKTTSMIHLGDTIYFRAWMRDPDEAENHAEIQVKVVSDRLGTAALIDRKVKVWHQWKEFKLAADTHDFYLPGQLSLSFVFPASSSIELAQVKLLNMGDTPAASLAQSTEAEPKSKAKKRRTNS